MREKKKNRPEPGDHGRVHRGRPRSQPAAAATVMHSQPSFASFRSEAHHGRRIPCHSGIADERPAPTGCGEGRQSSPLYLPATSSNLASDALASLTRASSSRLVCARVGVLMSYALVRSSTHPRWGAAATCRRQCQPPQIPPPRTSPRLTNASKSRWVPGQRNAATL